MNSYIEIRCLLENIKKDINIEFFSPMNFEFCKDLDMFNYNFIVSVYPKFPIFDLDIEEETIKFVEILRSKNIESLPYGYNDGYSGIYNSITIKIVTNKKYDTIKKLYKEADEFLSRNQSYVKIINKFSIYTKHYEDILSKIIELSNEM